MAAFETRQLLEPLEPLGVHAVLIAWSQGEGGSLKIGTTSGCPKEESERMLLKAALQLIKAKSPRLHAKLQIELARLEHET